MKQIELTQGKLALVDDEDYIIQNVFAWHYIKTKSGGEYAIRNDNSDPNNRQKSIYLHREIMCTPQELDCDHIDGNGLNNRRSNLRNCTRSQNSHNSKKTTRKTSSIFKGVCKHTSNNSWVGKIHNGTKLLHLGSFLSEKDAAIAYDRKAIELFGEFARTNFPKEEYL